MNETYYIVADLLTGKEIVDETEDLEEAMFLSSQYTLAFGEPCEVRQAIETSEELVLVWED